MEASATTDHADEDDMSMEAEPRPQDDDTYLTPDQMDVDARGVVDVKPGGTGPGSNQDKTSNWRRDTAAPQRPGAAVPNPRPPHVPLPPLPDRYLTLRPPPKGQSRAPPSKDPRSPLSRYGVVLLLTLCSLLTGAICALSINYGTLRKDHNKLREEQQDLTQQIKTLQTLSQPLYNIYDWFLPNGSDGVDQLFILNYNVLHERRGRNFFLRRTEQINNTSHNVTGWFCSSL